MKLTDSIGEPVQSFTLNGRQYKKGLQTKEDTK